MHWDLSVADMNSSSDFAEISAEIFSPNKSFYACLHDFAGTVSLGVTEGQVSKDSASSFHPSFLVFFLTTCSNHSILSCWFKPKKIKFTLSEQGWLGVRADAQIVLSALAKYGFSSWNFPCSEVQDFLSSLAWMDGKNNSLE